ncbi:hypothetical protein B9J76_08265 [Lacticaseibacillus paracasei]|uniref:helix-turn-helix transcriptional regulator n=1 Tax=Lacticaseibacillus paracasei TaxID=1597 RepID=UPI000A1F7398|nr:AraC family transcriptional regulator [Lacticaseibacillus paracasei]OSP84433.1 hypothetical protein B9J76_08265 [Lacticaseibacillus paracasei]
MSQSISDLLTEFHLSSKLPLYVLDDYGHICESFHLTVTPDLPKGYTTSILQVKPEEARVFTSQGNEYFSVIGTEDQRQRFILIWINARTLEQTGYYEDQFPSIGIHRLVSYTKVLYFALFRRFPIISFPTTITDTTFSTASSKYQDKKSNYEPVNHNSYAKESLMLAAVEAGDLATFNLRLKELIQSGSFGQMSGSSEIRNKKNLALAATTLISRAAIRGGMQSHAAFSLSDHCCQRIEHINNISSVSNLIQEIGALFISRIHSRIDRPMSLAVAKMMEYITAQTHGRLNLETMASVFGYTRSYMCTMFRRQAGMTIINYANIQKIREAKSLLTFTNLAIAEISESLAFSDQSYLTRLFVRFEKMTPREYRKTYHI